MVTGPVAPMTSSRMILEASSKSSLSEFRIRTGKEPVGSSRERILWPFVVLLISETMPIIEISSDPPSPPRRKLLLFKLSIGRALVLPRIISESLLYLSLKYCTNCMYSPVQVECPVISEITFTGFLPG